MELGLLDSKYMADNARSIMVIYQQVEHADMIQRLLTARGNALRIRNFAKYLDCGFFRGKHQPAIKQRSIRDWIAMAD